MATDTDTDTNTDTDTDGPGTGTGTVPPALKEVGVAVLAVVALAAVAYSAGYALTALTGTASASVQANLVVPDASTEAAEVDEVYIEWVGSGDAVSWQDAPKPVEEVTLTIYVESPDGDMQKAHGWQWGPDAPMDRQFEPTTDGSVDTDVGIGLFAATDWTPADFQPDPGGNVSHTLDVRVDVEASWDGGSVTASQSDTTTLTVTHPDEEQADPSVTIGLGEAIVDIAPAD